MVKRVTIGAGILALVFLLAFAGCRPGGTKTDDAAEFYKGKTITIVVPYAAGGGTDTQSRIFAPYLQKYTGAGNVVIENMTGAGGNRGNNYVYNTAKPDGLTLGAHLGDTLILAQLLGQEGVQYDVANYNWIGRWFVEVQALSIGAKLSYTTPKELAGLKPFKVGTITLASPTTLNVAIFAEAFKLDNMKLIAGYTGTAEIMLAVGQGEVHGFTTDLSVLGPFVKAGTVKLFAVFSEQRAPSAPDVPTIYELAKQAGVNLTGDTAKWLALQKAGAGLRRALTAPPNMPKDRVEFLRDAFMKAVQDKEWQAAWQKAGIPLDNPGRGDELQKAAAQTKMSEQDIKAFKFLLMEKYVK